VSAREPGRLWRTEKGDLVPDGHPEALVLAYGISDELADEDQGKVRAGKSHTPKVEAEATSKKREPKASSKG
jgi:hypothetical protein